MSKQQLFEDLPWYVNDSLPQEQKTAIAKALDTEADLKQEADFLHHIRQQVKQTATATPGELGLQRLKRQVQQQAAASQSRKWRAWAMAASVVLVVQAAVMLNLVQQQDDVFTPLSGTTPGTGVLQIQFNADAREADIRRLLQQFDAVIIDGPSSTGLYRIQLAGENADSLEQRVTELRSHRDVVEFVTGE